MIKLGNLYNLIETDGELEVYCVFREQTILFTGKEALDLKLKLLAAARSSVKNGGSLTAAFISIIDPLF